MASDALGVSGKLRLRAVAAGETDAEQRSHVAQRTLKRKQSQLQQAPEGRVTSAQRWILGQVLDQYDHVEGALQKKALVAVGHRILVIASHVLQTRTPYQDLGSEYCERRNVDRQRKGLIRQLEALGVKVTVEEVKEAA